MNISIDQDLILKAEASSTKDRDEREIYDLEFGLSLMQSEEDVEKKNPEVELAMDSAGHEPMAVCVRSNVTNRRDDLTTIPGEYLATYNKPYFDRERNRDLPEVQNFEKLYYQPCSYCKRPYNDPGCRCGSTL
ncbi:hypothetical protein [Endozoicomonas atrinae]|uniref:hypothetical protein n=1 Tax=Endozoicomonas atrinae TaxID=1333660 RepID=UPI001112EAC9|nr:hypothetical protein [Endozoicomonas atrinae]